MNNVSMNDFIKSIIRTKFVTHLLTGILKFNLWRKWKVKKYLRNTQEPKLQIGSGTNPLHDWLNTGVSVRECWTGVYMDAGKPFSLPDDTFYYVFAEHLFEHLTYSQALNLLKESYRVLKPGGVIRLATPDLQFLLGLYQEPEKPLHKEYIEYSAKDGGIPATPVFVINRFHIAWGHKIIYDKDTLAELLKLMGFKDICWCEVSQSTHPALRNIEGHFKILPAEFNRLETMVVEATK